MSIPQCPLNLYNSCKLSLVDNSLSLYMPPAPSSGHYSNTSRGAATLTVGSTSETGICVTL